MKGVSGHTKRLPRRRILNRSEIRTPSIDRLAERGLRFTHFYNNAVCVATRASLLTGLYPQQIASPYGRHLQRGEGNVTIAEVLRMGGYRTLGSGKWHSGPNEGERPMQRGFDRFWGLLSGCSNYFNPGEKRTGEAAPVHKTPRKVQSSTR
jgi:arylsulfatase